MSYLIKSSTVPLINRILEEPEAVALVQAMEPQVLEKLIKHIGLEEAGEIIALATAPQIAQIFDADLWRNRKPGQEETFDAERFLLWLEVMVATSVEEAANKLVAMDENFTLMVLNRFLMVLKHEDLLAMLEDKASANLAEKALSNHKTRELNTYFLISKDNQAWDAITSLLVEADQNNNDWLERQLHRCRIVSTAFIEDNDGLYHVLTDAEKLAADVDDEREQRRESQGHVAPQTASHFLAVISHSSLEELAAATKPDPITRAYFYSFAPKTATPGLTPAEQLPPGPEPSLRLTQILQDAKVIVEVPAEPAAASPADSYQLLRQTLAQLADKTPELHQQRILELGFLANILMVGHAYKHRRYLPAEAAQAVVNICNKGMAYVAKQNHLADTAEARLQLIREQDLVKMFKIGWKLLHE